MKKTLVFLLLLGFFLPVGASALNQQQEINKLRQTVVKLAKSNKQNDTILKNKLANAQARLLIKSVSYEIYIYLKKTGTKRQIKHIENMVEAAYLCSWIFIDLGENHMDRFELMLQWAQDETNFNPHKICYWKKGQYIASINKTVREDTVDYGGWQVNEWNEDYIKKLNALYASGVVNFKISKINSIRDVMDIKTNCAARCLIEVDRKQRGWTWKHIKSKEFFRFIKKTVSEIETKGDYNRVLASEYYYITPIKTYSVKK
jgi:hypothetical protein